MIRIRWIVPTAASILILLPVTVHAGGWAKAFGGIGDEAASSVQQTADGGYIVTGNSGDGAWLIKLDSNSRISWRKSYSAGSARFVQQTSDSSYVVAGITSLGAGGNDGWVLKLDGAGAVEWEKAYGGADEDLVYSIQQTADGGYIVAGETYSFGAGDSDMWVLKLNETGDVTWQYTYGGGQWDYSTHIQQTDDDGYIVSGVTYSFGPGNGDIWVLKLDGNGIVEWERTYGLNIGSENTESDPHIRQTTDGGYIVAATTSPIGINSKAWILKLHTDGGIDWQKTYSTIPDYIVSSIQQTTDGDYIVAGRKGAYIGIDFLGDAWVMKLGVSGNIEWQYTYGGSELPETEDDYASSIRQTMDGGYIVAGATESFGLTGYDFWLLRLDEDGQISNCSAAMPWSGSSEDTFEAGEDSSETVISTTIVGFSITSTVMAPAVIEMDGCNPFMGNMLDLPETGQTTSFYTGDDGDLRHGVIWPSPRFVDNGDGTVTDALTGLVWLKDANCANTIGHDPGGSGNGSMTWEHALDFVSGINDGTYDISDCASYTAGETDWRLTNINEIESLFNPEEANSATWLNGQGFENVQHGLYEYDRYWSSTTYSNNQFRAWSLYMGDGWLYSAFKSPSNFYAWPVRAGQQDLPDAGFPANLWKTGQMASFYTEDDGDLRHGVIWPSPRFIDNGDGTVTDALTGLMWLKDADCFGATDWQTAMDIVSDFNSTPTNYDCADYDESNPPYDNWSLPNRKELYSLIDYSEWQPALPLDHPFLNPPSIAGYWSSTTWGTATDHAWVVLLRTGAVDRMIKSSSNYHIWPLRMANPVPEIRANGSDGPVTITAGDALSITIALDATGNVGDDADWWSLASTPFGWYHYNVSGEWIPGQNVTFQGPLFDLPNFEVLNMSRLPAGSYTFYFGVDMNMNGFLDPDQMYYDIVEVVITP
jgi:hypothetical protein